MRKNEIKTTQKSCLKTEVGKKNRSQSHHKFSSESLKVFCLYAWCVCARSQMNSNIAFLLLFYRSIVTGVSHVIFCRSPSLSSRKSNYFIVVLGFAIPFVTNLTILQFFGSKKQTVRHKNKIKNPKRKQKNSEEQNKIKTIEQRNYAISFCLVHINFHLLYCELLAIFCEQCLGVKKCFFYW